MRTNKEEKSAISSNTMVLLWPPLAHKNIIFLSFIHLRMFLFAEGKTQLYRSFKLCKIWNLDDFLKILRNNLGDMVFFHFILFFSRADICIKGEHDPLHMFSMRTMCSTIINLKQALLTLTQRHCWIQANGTQTGISPSPLTRE